jgi:hypothetical protein
VQLGKKNEGFMAAPGHRGKTAIQRDLQVSEETARPSVRLRLTQPLVNSQPVVRIRRATTSSEPRDRRIGATDIPWQCGLPRRSSRCRLGLEQGRRSAIPASYEQIAASTTSRLKRQANRQDKQRSRAWFHSDVIIPCRAPAPHQKTEQSPGHGPIAVPSSATVTFADLSQAIPLPL